MDISNENFDESKKAKTAGKKGNKKLLVSILVFVILIFVSASLILADNIYTKYAVGNAVSSAAQEGISGKKASKQGNLGNFNVESKNNSISDQGNGTYLLTLELEFTNYSSEGCSFNDAVDVTAYQNNKEVRAESGIDFSADDDSQSAAQPFAADESDLKVRNSQSEKVILKYELKDNTKDVNIEMKSGSNSFTYTVNLAKASNSGAAAAQSTAEAKSK